MQFHSQFEKQLSGKRVCRRPDPTESPHVSALDHTSHFVTVLPSWENLISSRRKGGRKKSQHRVANTNGGAWKHVDHHVAQLKRKSACFDRYGMYVLTLDRKNLVCTIGHVYSKLKMNEL